MTFLKGSVTQLPFLLLPKQFGFFFVMWDSFLRPRLLLICFIVAVTQVPIQGLRSKYTAIDCYLLLSHRKIKNFNLRLELASRSLYLSRAMIRLRLATLPLYTNMGLRTMKQKKKEKKIVLVVTDDLYKYAMARKYKLNCLYLIKILMILLLHLNNEWVCY